MLKYRTKKLPQFLSWFWKRLIIIVISQRPYQGLYKSLKVIKSKILQQKMINIPEKVKTHFVQFNFNVLLEQVGKDRVKDILSSFSCPLNPDVEFFWNLKQLSKLLQCKYQWMLLTNILFECTISIMRVMKRKRYLP